ncbi:MAG: T9SS type A sorting domain-containing protein [Bacteroidetes bacterium]|nr:T9SS type A sorting domain-containing protein [Bacteroidota bacterium]
MMKKLLTLLTLLLALNTNIFSQYSNATINGAWFMNIPPQNPYGDSLLYIVFDGNGNITDFSGFCGSIGGTYTVTTGGALAGSLVCDGSTFPLTAQLITSTTGSATADGITWDLTKISNEGLLGGKLQGSLITQNCGSKSVELYVGNTGLITSATGLMSTVTGRAYSEGGMFMCHLRTGETNSWNQVSIMGYYSNNLLTGEVGIDNNSCGINSANLTRVDVISVKQIVTQSSLSVFPNPSTGKYTINLNDLTNNQKTGLIVFNNLGEVLLTENIINSSAEIDLSKFASGVYTLSILNGDQHYFKKLIKE